MAGRLGCKLLPGPGLGARDPSSAHPRAARALDARVVLLDHGAIVADGSPADVLDDAALLEAHGF